MNYEGLLQTALTAMNNRLADEGTIEDLAEAALKAIQDAGLAVVPREANGYMAEAAVIALTDCIVDEPKARAWDSLRAAYKAMIEAGEIKPALVGDNQ